MNHPSYIKSTTKILPEREESFFKAHKCLLIYPFLFVCLCISRSTSGKKTSLKKPHPISRGLTLSPLTAMKPLASSDGFGPSSADKSIPAPVRGPPGPQQCPPRLPAASHLHTFAFRASPGHCQGSAGG